MRDAESIALWESKSGKFWLELFRDSGGYFYRHLGGGGIPSNNAPQSAVIAEMESKVWWSSDYNDKDEIATIRRVR